MTGIERLRMMAKTDMANGHASESRVLSNIADQIEREQGEHVSRMRVLSVITDMERHVLGHEGMEDSPVARWARELRAALGGSDDEVTDVATVRKDAMEAYEWVEAHGGLDAMIELSSRLMTADAALAAIEETCTRIGVERTGDLTQDVQAIWREVEALRSRLRESVPRAAYERHLARLQRQIDESHAALRRRNGRIAELERNLSKSVSGQLKADAALYELQRGVRDQCMAFGVDISECDTASDMLHDMNESLSKRLMPEGMVWPCFEDGEPVKLGEEAIGFVRKPSFVVDHVTIFAGGEATVCAEAHHDSGKVANFVRVFPSERVKRPAPKVLDADGAEIRARDHVWHVETGQEYVVVSICYEDGIVVIRAGDKTSEHEQYAPSLLTHERPDSWERLEEDAKNENPVLYCKKRGIDCEDMPPVQAIRVDLVRRARALAERGQ